MVVELVVAMVMRKLMTRKTTLKTKKMILSTRMEKKMAMTKKMSTQKMILRLKMGKLMEKKQKARRLGVEMSVSGLQFSIQKNQLRL